MLVLFGLLLASLYLLSEATQRPAGTERLHVWLLVVNGIGLVLLLVLIAANLYRLLRAYRLRAPGARLTARMVLMFVVLIFTPLSIVYYFSVQFLNRGIDSWFNVEIESALHDALELSRASLDVRMRELLRQTQAMANELNSAGGSSSMAALTLDDMRLNNDVDELTLIAQNGRIIASSIADPTRILPNKPGDDVLFQVRSIGNYVGLDSINGTLYIRAVVALHPAGSATLNAPVLQALYPVAERLGRLAASVQTAFSRYTELTYLRGPLKASFVMTLSLVLLLSLFAAVLAAFASARRLTAPIRDLVEGTHAVAEGDYSKRLPEIGGDELGVLVRSFNEMTRRVARARDDASRSQLEAESQRAYLEAVLSRLSSGVLVLDHNLEVRIVNAVASQILGVGTEVLLDGPLGTLGTRVPALQPLVDALQPYAHAGATEWRLELTLFGVSGRKVLLCRGTTLPGDGGHAGHVVVFDDVTALIQAQRDAAWGEVARRLAHEIKNPLTPIQLSAERLRHKYLGRLEGKDAEVLDRATHTIVQQVEAMKEMVNAFSEYARSPRTQLAPLDLNSLIREVLDLYRGPGAAVTFEDQLEPTLPAIKADSGRLRQLLHNLVKNAMEACSEAETPRVLVLTRCLAEAECNFIELFIEDNGHGIPEELLGQLFEPYVTTKTKGTGLGLAIVKKIVEEHGGVIWAENVAPQGARMAIRLPVRPRERDEDARTEGVEASDERGRG